MRGRKAVACLVIAWSGNSRTVVNAGWREPRHFPPSRRALSIPQSRPLITIRGGADEAQRKEEEETEEVVVKSAKEQDETESTTEETSTTESTETLKEGPLLAEQNKDELTEEEQAAQEERRQEAVALRQEGKDLHDEGKWEQAAVTFDKAANILSEINNDNDFLEEYATCRLHQALCRLKNQNFDECIEACSALLTREPPAPIRARALHRRARAKLGLDDTEGALQDARSAAFLGDRKAVALYGKLMRNDSDGESNPFSTDAASSSSLLESLLQKSSDTTGSTAGGNPLSSLLLGNNNNNKNGNNLAQSVIKSLSKQVENEATQERLCGYLQKTNTAQVQQLLGMAGVPLGESAVEKLVSMCHSVTPRLIQKYVKLSKRLWYGISLVKKVMQLLSKYRLLLIFCLLLAWIKSALQRPIPINKKALKQAMKAQAAAAAAAAASAEAAATVVV